MNTLAVDFEVDTINLSRSRSRMSAIRVHGHWQPLKTCKYFLSPGLLGLSVDSVLKETAKKPVFCQHKHLILKARNVVHEYSTIPLAYYVVQTEHATNFGPMPFGQPQCFLQELHHSISNSQKLTEDFQHNFKFWNISYLLLSFGFKSTLVFR